MLNSPTNVQTYAQAVQQAVALSQQISGIALQTANQTMIGSYLNTLANAYGEQEKNRLTQYNERASVLLDIQNLSLKTNYGLMNKQVELSLLEGQVREKLVNLFIDLERTKLDNTFQRAKSVVQAAKY